MPEFSGAGLKVILTSWPVNKPLPDSFTSFSIVC